MKGVNAMEVGGVPSPSRGRFLIGAPFPPPQEVADRVDDAKKAGTFGGLRRKSRLRAQEASEAPYVVTCGGCAFAEEIAAFDRPAAIARALERGWLRRFVPGVPKSRFFCEACQDDMRRRRQAYWKPGEDWETANARWRKGNPVRLPSGHEAAGGGPPSGAGARRKEPSSGTSGPGEESLLGVANRLILALSELQIAVSREAEGASAPALAFALLRSVELAREAGVEPPPVVVEFLEQEPDATP